MLILLDGRVKLMAVVALEPQKVRPLNGGQLVNGVEFFKLLGDLQKEKQTGRVLTHSQLDRALTVFWNQLDSESKVLLRNYWTRGRTALAKPEDGGEFKRVYTSTDSGLSVEIVLPQILVDANRGKDGRGTGAVFDITDTNCRITPSQDGKSVTIELLDSEELRDVRILQLVNGGSWGKANDSTLWIPAKETLDGGPSEERYFNVPKGEYAGAPGRLHYDLFDGWRGVYAYGPSFRAGVLELAQGESVASAKLAAAQSAARPDAVVAKPDVRLLAASAEEAVGKLVVTVKPELLQPIIELINATKQ